jgi:hypothetical protein
MRDAERIARALNGKRTTDGFLCRCPVAGHGKGKGDRNLSLFVKDGERAPLVTCFSGCDPHDAMPCGAADFWIILAALGQMRPHARTAREHRKRRTPPILKRWRFGARPPSAPTRSSSIIGDRGASHFQLPRRFAAAQSFILASTSCRRWLNPCFLGNDHDRHS